MSGARAGRARCTPSRADVPGSLDVAPAAISVRARPARCSGRPASGKSTIVNRLVGHELLRTRGGARVRQPRPSHQHGRQLVLLPEAGVLIDTPGHARAAAVGQRRAARRHVRRHRGAGGELPLSRLPSPPGARLRGARARSPPAACPPAVSRAPQARRTSRRIRRASRISAPSSSRSAGRNPPRRPAEAGERKGRQSPSVRHTAVPATPPFICCRNVRFARKLRHARLPHPFRVLGLTRGRLPI